MHAPLNPVRAIIPCAATLALALSVPVAMAGEAPPEPAEFPVAAGDCSAAPPSRPPDPALRHHRSEIHAARERPPDFAGCWRVVELPCGAECRQVVLVHPASGATRWGPIASSGTSHGRESGLLVVDPDAIVVAPRYYVFDTASARFVPLTPYHQPGPMQVLPPIAVPESAARLHARLRRIAAERDAAAITGLLADDVLVSFGGSGGPGEFRAHWGLESEPGASRLWPLLQRLVRHPPEAVRGDDGAMHATWPHWFPGWPDDRDPYGHVFADDFAVPVQAAPEPDAEVLDRVSFLGLASGEEPPPPPGWTAVHLGDGRTGYIAAGQRVFPVLGHRLLARRGPDGWRIDALVSGD